MLVPVRGTSFLPLIAINICNVNVYTECDLHWNKAGVHCSNNKICRVFPTELGMSQYTYSGSGTHGPHITMVAIGYLHCNGIRQKLVHLAMSNVQKSAKVNYFNFTGAPCSLRTQQQMRPHSLASSATHATPSLWWPLLESTGV